MISQSDMITWAKKKKNLPQELWCTLQIKNGRWMPICTCIWLTKSSYSQLTSKAPLISPTNVEKTIRSDESEDAKPRTAFVLIVTLLKEIKNPTIFSNRLLDSPPANLLQWVKRLLAHKFKITLKGRMLKGRRHASANKKLSHYCPTTIGQN